MINDKLAIVIDSSGKIRLKYVLTKFVVDTGYYNLARRTCNKVYVLVKGCRHTYYLE
jgi:hypothetical protein